MQKITRKESESKRPLRKRLRNGSGNGNGRRG